MIQKQADASMGAKLTAALLGLGLMASDAHHRAVLEQEAEMMNEAIREMEDRKMRQTVESLSGRKLAAAEREMLELVKSAAALAMGKEAGMGSSLLAAGGGLLGKGVEGAKKLVGSLPGPSLKTKLLGAGALLGTGIATMKGLQKGRDYLAAQPTTKTWGGAAPIHHNVNEWGYPE